MNHKHISFTRGPTAALWALASLAVLLTTRPAAADPNAHVELKFRLAAFDSDVSGVSFDTSGKPMPAAAHTYERSPWYSYSGPALLTLYKPGPADKDGKPTKVTVASIDLSNAPKVPLILLISDASKPGTYTSLILDDNYTDLPYGAIAFYDFTNEDDVVGLDGVTKTIKAGGDHVVLKNKPKDNSGFYAATVMRVGAQDGAMLVQDNWPYRTDFRRVVFIVGIPDAGGAMTYSAKWIDEQNVPPINATAPASGTTGGNNNNRQQGGNNRQQGGNNQQNRNNNAGG